MKLITAILLVFWPLVERPSTDSAETERILKAWISTQNEGTDEAIREFINTYYSPGMLKKMKNYEDHVNFYRSIISDFGDLQEAVYKTESDQSHHLKVQLLKRITPLVPEPKPEEILVVQIDLDPEQPRYLSRGLGMGALVCYIKR